MIKQMKKGEGLCLGVKRLPHGADLALPEYATTGSAGMDLLAALTEPYVLRPGERTLVPCGIAIELPVGFEAQVRPRSGLALKHGITVLNAPGTIDADYRGEIGVILINLGETSLIIKRAMRIAQMVVAPVTAIEWCEVQELRASQRGMDGFGSSGTTKKLGTVKVP